MAEAAASASASVVPTPNVTSEVSTRQERVEEVKAAVKATIAKLALARDLLNKKRTPDEDGILGLYHAISPHLVEIEDSVNRIAELLASPDLATAPSQPPPAEPSVKDDPNHHGKAGC